MVAEVDALPRGPAADGAREVWRRRLPGDRARAGRRTGWRSSPTGAGRSGPGGVAGERCPRWSDTACDRAGADRLRGLPAPLGGRHLPVQPRRRRHPRRAASTAPDYDLDAAGRGRSARPCTTPSTSTPPSRTRRSRRGAGATLRTSPADPTTRPEARRHDRLLDQHLPTHRTAELRDARRRRAAPLRRRPGRPARRRSRRRRQPGHRRGRRHGALRRTPRTSSAAVDRRARGVPAVAHRARRRCAAGWSSGSASCSPSTRSALADLVGVEVGKIRSEALRRGPGDDRHLRLRRRAVAPARRPHDALGAARAPADGDVAPARASSA